MLEAGLVRAKNTAEILTKNIALYAIACIMYMIVGYGIMYPAGGNGITNWDSHSDILETHAMQAEIMDQPTAALISDMKRRGLLENTLVVWCTEFGRMPFLQGNGTGRDHNPSAFTCFFAGAGVKKGFSYGETDEFSYRAVKDVATVFDFHATILHLLGLDHERLTYYHNGFERRLTDVHGHVIKDVLA
jgi:hypothetical protein